ncbi:MAG: bifunctional oligoribonuclease/PAP phosphatase NrnA [Verrucomicrobiota bacterium]|nr:bifunctional oligoribonuclease/PAP phosphatase NrnA [Verrucomicrobiota bacterium]
MTYLPEHAWQFRRLLESLRGKRVAVLGHVRPDGDCIGSQVALVRMLRALGVDAFAVNQHEVPKNCQKFVGDTPFFAPVKSIPAADIHITTDCAELNRIGLVLSANPPPIFMCVDHHISNITFAEHNFVYPNLGAACEILARFAFEAEIPVDATTAQALYVGIATDTGQFCYSGSTSDVFRICARLIEHGANAAGASSELYEHESRSKLALLQRFLASFEYICNNRVCIGTITRDVWTATGATKEDTEGLVNYARVIDGVEIGVLIEEHADFIKGSFRAKDAVHRVDQIAASFNGGGHACAAGFNPGKTLAEFRPLLIQRLEAHFAAIDAAAPRSSN